MKTQLDELQKFFSDIASGMKKTYKSYLINMWQKYIDEVKDDYVGKKSREAWGMYPTLIEHYQIIKYVFKAQERIDGTSCTSNGASILGIIPQNEIDALLEKEASYAVDMFYTGFINKNVKKFDDILKGRNIKSKKCNLNGLCGYVNVVLENNASFTASFDVITKLSSKNKLFNQFPTRFTNVIFEDGSPMKSPSESKMKKLF